MRLDPDQDVRLEALIRRGERLRARLPFDELRELARLYRVTSARLARLRSAGRDVEAIGRLNTLCVRAYALVYAEPEPEATGSFGRRLFETLARTWRVQVLASGLLLMGAFLGGVSASDDPRVRAGLVGFYSAAQLEELAESPAARQAFLERRDVGLGRNALFGAQLFFNNTRVGLLAFALGILAGVPTLGLLIYNGLVLGAFATLFLAPEELPLFLAWIVPHAIPELLAVVLCASGGLLLGSAVLCPRRQRYSEAIAQQGRHALRLVGASVVLFAVAALIESFVRESTLSTAARATVAVTVLAAIVLYVLAIARAARRLTGPDLSWLGLELPVGAEAGSGAARADRAPRGDE